MLFDIPTGVDRPERVAQVLAAAEAEAKKRNWKMNIAVVDTNGELVHFSRMEGAQIASVNVSIGKARTRRASAANPACSTTPSRPVMVMSRRSIPPWSRAPADFRWSKAAS